MRTTSPSNAQVLNLVVAVVRPGRTYPLEEIYAEIGRRAPTHKAQQVRNALQTLKRAGRLQRTGFGRYVAK